MVQIKAHKNVFEYDGSFKCLDCGKRWGAYPGVPKKEPKECDIWTSVIRKQEQLQDLIFDYMKHVELCLEELNNLIKKARKQ